MACFVLVSYRELHSEETGIDGVLICGLAKENVVNNGEWEANSIGERCCGLENDDAMAEESNDEEAKGTFEEAGGVNKMWKKRVAYMVLDSSVSSAQRWWTFWFEELWRQGSKTLPKQLRMKA